MAALAAPAFANDVAITVHYGNGQQMTFVGPADDAFCVARSTGLKLNATRIDIPAGNFRLQCPEITMDTRYATNIRWTPAGQMESSTINQKDPSAITVNGNNFGTPSVTCPPRK